MNYESPTVAVESSDADRLLGRATYLEGRMGRQAGVITDSELQTLADANRQLAGQIGALGIGRASELETPIVFTEMSAVDRFLLEFARIEESEKVRRRNTVAGKVKILLHI